MALIRHERTLEELDNDQQMLTVAAFEFCASLTEAQFRFRHFRWMCLEILMNDAVWLGLQPRRMLTVGDALDVTHWEAVVMSRPCRVLEKCLKRMGVPNELRGLVEDYFVVSICEIYVYFEF